MKWIVHVILLTFLPTCLFAQQTPFAFMSYMQKLHVTPGEQLIACTRAGEVAMSDSLNGLWHFCTIAPGFSSTLENALFFNRDTGFVSGFIFDNGSYKIIYHTQDGGKTWSKVDFGSSGWADAAYCLPNGEAWMTIAGNGVVYSKDYGLTWKTFIIYDVQQRYQTIYFNPQHEGIAGSVWNTIAYTWDNCQHWKKIPSPLDQQAYKKTDSQRRPEIDKVCIYKDLLLVSEEGMIFYTKKDTIKWKPLHDYVNFSTDATNTALYLINKAGQVVKTDEQLQPLVTTPFTGNINDLFTRNGKLFLFGNSGIQEINAEGKLIKHPLLKQGTETPDTTEIYAYDGKKYGISGNTIFTETKDEEWKYAFTLPFPIYDPGKVSIHKDDLYYETIDSVYYYDIQQHKSKAAARQELLDNFRLEPITDISFSVGFAGCFASGSNTLHYRAHKNEFVLSKIDTGKVQFPYGELAPGETIISRESVTQFVQEICLHYDRQYTLKEIGFSAADYKQCKEDITAFQHAKSWSATPTAFNFSRNNLDFDQLIAMADSVRNMDSVALNRALLQQQFGYSTSSNRISVNLKNKAGSRLSITCTYYGANALYIPWRINIDGAEVLSISPAVLSFLQENCPSMIKEKNKVQVLHELVKATYSRLVP